MGILNWLFGAPEEEDPNKPGAPNSGAPPGNYIPSAKKPDDSDNDPPCLELDFPRTAPPNHNHGEKEREEKQRQEKLRDEQEELRRRLMSQIFTTNQNVERDTREANAQQSTLDYWLNYAKERDRDNRYNQERRRDQDRGMER